jgi:hypothetical protein
MGRAGRCRVCTAFSHYLWTPECNAFCPETCPAQGRKQVVLTDVRRRHRLLFGSRTSWSGAWSGPCQAQALSEELLGHAGGSSGGTDAFSVIPSVAEGSSLSDKPSPLERRPLGCARGDGFCFSRTTPDTRNGRQKLSGGVRSTRGLRISRNRQKTLHGSRRPMAPSRSSTGSCVPAPSGFEGMRSGRPGVFAGGFQAARVGSIRVRCARSPGTAG